MPAAADRVTALNSTTTRYTILEFIGEGLFGKVAKCWDHNNSRLVAVKILKKEYFQDVEDELSVLKIISSLNVDHFNLVTFYEQFEDLGLNCLVFKLLDVNLSRLVRSMNANDIRPIAKQLMVALQGLQSVGVLHTDIKPENIMITNIDESPYSVKLIDFGMAFTMSSIMTGITCQPIGYRAPEVCLGLPYSGAIDMWGVGCTLAFLYLNDVLFPVHCKYLMMKSMVEILGMPSNSQLHCGLYSKKFFTHEVDESGTKWRLLTPEEYTTTNNKKAAKWSEHRPHWSSLDDLLYTSELEENETMDDRKAFIEFLEELLNLDGEERISPREALQHPYITESYLRQEPDNSEHQPEIQLIRELSPEDWDAEYPLPLTKTEYGHIEVHSPEDWEAEYPLPLTNMEYGHIEVHSPEDWEAEYPLPLTNTEYGHIEVHSPEDWEAEYPLPLKNTEYGHIEVHSPEDWEAEYPLPLTNTEYRHIEVHSPEDWEAEYPLPLTNMEYGHIEVHSPEDLDIEFPLPPTNSQCGHIEERSPEDWEC